MDPFRDYLEKRWQEGQHNGLQLWTEINRRGFQAAGRPSTGGPPPARSGHRPLRQICGGARHRAGIVHGS